MMAWTATPIRSLGRERDICVVGRSPHHLIRPATGRGASPMSARKTIRARRSDWRPSVAEWVSGASEIHGIQSDHWPGFGFVFIVFTEFRRAVAAQQRYEDLKGKGTAALAREGIARADIPRRIFEEFYSLGAQ
jgi:hypothetical protein